VSIWNPRMKEDVFYSVPSISFCMETYKKLLGNKVSEIIMSACDSTNSNLNCVYNPIIFLFILADLLYKRNL